MALSSQRAKYRNLHPTQGLLLSDYYSPGARSNAGARTFIGLVLLWVEIATIRLLRQSIPSPA
jgi:hypothetical protein